MTRTVFASFAAVLFSIGVDASAHRIDEYLQATLLTVESHRVEGSMRLVPGSSIAASVIAQIDADADGVFSPAEQRAYAIRVMDDLSITIDGRAVRPELAAWTFPPVARMRDGTGEVQLRYVVDLPDGAGDRRLTLTNRHLGERSVSLVNVLAPDDPSVRVLEQKRNLQQSVYELDFREVPVAARSRSAAGRDGLQLASLFRLGMLHIAEGSDHLMFLLVMLLPAPLNATDSRWGRPVGVQRGLLRALAIVTAFTVGHSLTLALAAAGGIALPNRLVETLIATSILAGAVHAWRPIFPGREVAVTALFGLVHGLAFAAILDRLGAHRGDRVAGTLAFNLGVEAMQMVVVVAVLPSLLLLARWPGYRTLRVAAAAFAGIAAFGWIVERVADVATPVDAIVDALAQHALAVAGVLLLGALIVGHGDDRSRANGGRISRFLPATLRFRREGP